MEILPEDYKYWVSPTKAASLLCISRRTLYNWIKVGRLKSVKNPMDVTRVYIRGIYGNELDKLDNKLNSTNGSN